MQHLSLILLLAIMGSCSQISTHKGAHVNNWSPANFYAEGFVDSLVVDMVTYIGRKPPLATSQTRFDQEFRSYYEDYATEFKLIYLFVAEDGTHYYYLTRPGRHTRGNRRGVGGFFTMDGQKISGFVELFNTHVMFEEELKDIGPELFKSMLETGQVDEFLDREGIIEWPDERLKYDKELFEWRYINQG